MIFSQFESKTSLSAQKEEHDDLKEVINDTREVMTEDADAKLNNMQGQSLKLIQADKGSGRYVSQANL